MFIIILFYFFVLGNLWLRKNMIEDKSELILFDWECCCIHVPQRDVAFFLMTVVDPKPSPAENLHQWRRYTDYYHQHLLAAIHENNDQEIVDNIKDKNKFDRMIYFQLIEALLNRTFLFAVVPKNSTPDMVKICRPAILCLIEEGTY